MNQPMNQPMNRATNPAAGPALQVYQVRLRSTQPVAPRQAQAIAQAFGAELNQALAGRLPGPLTLRELVLDLGATAPPLQATALRHAAQAVARRILDRLPG